MHSTNYVCFVVRGAANPRSFGIETKRSLRPMRCPRSSVDSIGDGSKDHRLSSSVLPMNIPTLEHFKAASSGGLLAVRSNDRLISRIDELLANFWQQWN